jgi:hypothetical protein
MKKISIDTDLLFAAIPEARLISVLPRKKKKALKKKVARDLILILTYYAMEIFEEEQL